MDALALAEQKRALRAVVRARMPRPGTAEFASASLAAQERLAAFVIAVGARTVAIYRPLPSECGTAALAAALEASGKEICYPVVVRGERVLEFRRGAGIFVAGSLGVEEPTGTPVRLEEIDLLVVPAIAADSSGGRLGRGKGHFDATLAASRARSVALVFEAQLVPSVPLGEDDQPVDAVCTESRLLVVP